MDQKPVFSKRKLALWYTRNFKPIMTHRELEPIMINLGFLGLPPSIPGFGNGSPWKEYIYKAGEMCWDHHMMDLSPPPPRPRLRLPYPRIDGLHIKAYEVFLDAITFYIKMDDISLLFHVRYVQLYSSTYEFSNFCFEFYFFRLTKLRLISFILSKFVLR